MQTIHRYTIQPEEARQRVDVFLCGKFHQFARTAIVRLFESGHVLVNGTDAKPGYRLREADQVFIDLGPLNFTPADIDLPVLFEDENVVVVNKPSGIISHARGKFWDEPSVASFIRKKVSDMGGERAGIVHRLDRATSGVMICAKNQQALSWLQRQFSDRRVEKEYCAIITGRLDPAAAIIDMPIERNPKAPATFKVGSNGKSAQTAYEVISSNDKYSLVKLVPKTGRTHQLRVHLKQIGHPIVGDRLYGGEHSERLMLHAAKLSIILPGGQSMSFESPLPPEFYDSVR